jgi:hypothetical protein
MTAMAGAAGARSWLAAAHLTWLTPRRMRAASAGLFVAATLGSSLVLSGSSTPPAHAAAGHSAGVSAPAAVRSR